MGYKAVVKLLLEKVADIMAKCKVGETALHCAAGGGREAVVQLLLEKGADEVYGYSRRASARIGGQLWKQGSSAAAASG